MLLPTHTRRVETVHIFEPVVRDAGFAPVRSGNVRPWLRYVQALKATEPD